MITTDIERTSKIFVDISAARVQSWRTRQSHQIITTNSDNVTVIVLHIRVIVVTSRGETTVHATAVTTDSLLVLVYDNKMETRMVDRLFRQRFTEHDSQVIEMDPAVQLAETDDVGRHQVTDGAGVLRPRHRSQRDEKLHVIRSLRRTATTCPSSFSIFA